MYSVLQDFPPSRLNDMPVFELLNSIMVVSVQSCRGSQLTMSDLARKAFLYGVGALSGPLFAPFAINQMCKL